MIILQLMNDDSIAFCCLFLTIVDQTQKGTSSMNSCGQSNVPAAFAPNTKNVKKAMVREDVLQEPEQVPMVSDMIPTLAEDESGIEFDM